MALPPSSKSHQTSIVFFPCFFWNCVLASRSFWSATFKGATGSLDSKGVSKKLRHIGSKCQISFYYIPRIS